MYDTLIYGPQVGCFHEQRGVPDLQSLCDERMESRNLIGDPGGSESKLGLILVSLLTNGC